MSLLETRVAIETPERVEIVHEGAGIGSRFAAGSIDILLLSIPMCVAMCALAIVQKFGQHGTLSEEEVTSLSFAVVGVWNAILWTYYLLCEVISGGRTVGKHFLRLRVVSIHGGPATTGALLVRNLLRAFDMFPFVLHLVGGIVMFAGGKNRRLGDLAAGTIVVRERPVEGGTYAVVATPGGLSNEEAALVRNFLARRGSLRPDVRYALAEDIVSALRAAQKVPDVAHVPAEHMLALLGQGHTPEKLAELVGPQLAPAPPAAPGPSQPPTPNPQLPR